MPATERDLAAEAYAFVVGRTRDHTIGASVCEIAAELTISAPRARGAVRELVARRMLTRTAPHDPSARAATSSRRAGIWATARGLDPETAKALPALAVTFPLPASLCPAMPAAGSKSGATMLGACALAAVATLLIVRWRRA